MGTGTRFRSRCIFPIANNNSAYLCLPEVPEVVVEKLYEFLFFKKERGGALCVARFNNESSILARKKTGVGKKMDPDFFCEERRCFFFPNTFDSLQKMRLA